MFCIAAFIVFAILALFSATYRPLASKAWHCVLRRVTFRPCDITFGEELKGKLIGKLVFTHPHLARLLDRWIDWISFVFVLLSVWSVLYVANAGLNLWVYDTCSPTSAESCSLSGEACGIEQERLTLRVALQEQKMAEWFVGPFVRFAETLSRIPDRMKSWNAQDYVPSTATFYRTVDPLKPYALEVIDPGCMFCKKLTKNLKDAGSMERANVFYILYPILRGGTLTTKFPHSTLVASYIEAAKTVALPGADIPGDWQLLENIFAEPEGSDIDLQTRMNVGMTAEEVKATMESLLREIGYSADDIAVIATAASSQSVAASLAEQRAIVEQEIRTVKIPTLMIGGRRYDRVVGVEVLEDLR